MMRRVALLGRCATLFAVFGGVASAGTLHGTVQNGTTGKPASGVELVLMQLQAGMQPVANTKSDAQGQFTIDNANIGTQPMLLRAVYHDINFHQPVPPGATQVDITVYEATKDTKSISVVSRIVVFQPNGSTLTVGEEYSIQNSSQPPKAYFLAAGDFEFTLPADAKLGQVAAASSAGMPVAQAPIDKTKGRYSIAYAFRPGPSTIRVSYDLPYENNTANVNVASPYSAARLIVVAPPTVQVTAAGLQPNGQEQGMNLYVRENLAANTPLTVNLNGAAAPPADANAGGGQGRDAQEAPAGNIQVVPGRLDALKTPVIVGFVLLFGLGAFWLWKKPVVAVPVGVGDPVAAVPAQRAASPAVRSPAVAQTPVAANLKEMDAQVGTSLDGLKERLFKLELRRQAGTISEEEYARERARAEQVLRDLLRG